MSADSARGPADDEALDRDPATHPATGPGEPAGTEGSGDPGGPSGRTALAVSALLVASSALGLLRDLSLAGLFGASGDTDAFLVAWTIPETVSVLLMEGAMSYLLVPVFVRELARRDSISRVVRDTLLPFATGLAALTVLVILAAPLLVDVLAPGLTQRDLAITCFRIAAATVLFMGLCGYLMAALRANHRFLLPAATFVAYNVGILTMMFTLHEQLGVVSAALGLAVGAALMVLIQVPSFRRLTSLHGLRLKFDRGVVVAAAVFLPIAAYSLGRQMQVFVERVVGSTLVEGSISYMNYASKIAQMASLLALTAAAIAFPSLARMASDPAALRTRVEQEFRRLVLLIVPAIAFLCIFAEPCIRLLFERGAFTAEDTERTADVMRVYSLGLLGQVMVSLGAYVCFAGRNRSWIPAVGAAVGLVLTVVLDVALAPWLGVVALAIGNAAGIVLSAVIVWWGIGRRTVRYDARGLLRLIAFAAPLATACTAVAWAVCRLLPSNAFAEVAVGGTLTVALFLAVTAVLGVRESRDLARALIGWGGEVVRGRDRESS